MSSSTLSSDISNNDDTLNTGTSAENTSTENTSYTSTENISNTSTSNENISNNDTISHNEVIPTSNHITSDSTLTDEKQRFKKLPTRTLLNTKELTFEEFQVGLESTFKNAGPVLKVIMNIIDIIAPYFTYLVKVIDDVYNLLPSGLLPAIFGLILCFFGGSFPLTIATCEAIYIVGYEDTKQYLLDIYDEFKNVKLAIQQEDLLSDTKHKDSEILLMKSLKFFRLCKDPNKLSLAIQGLMTSFAAMMASLQSEFAKTITLSVSISKLIHKPVSRNVKPILMAIVPKDYQKWIDVVILWSLRILVYSIAYWLTKILSSLQSGVRGGLLAARSILTFMASKGYLDEGFDVNKTYIDEIIGLGLAFVGISKQLLNGFVPPFPLNFILFPFFIVENFLLSMLLKNSKI